MDKFDVMGDLTVEEKEKLPEEETRKLYRRGFRLVLQVFVCDEAPSCLSQESRKNI